MASETRCLATYIESIHYGDKFPPQRIFDCGITHPSPSLKSGRINRILVYPGSFNPPHLGHFELLRHGFMKSGRDMNIVAAIVLPLDDDSLVKKLRGQENAMIFKKAERIKLWKGDVPSDWYWTYDRSVKEWSDFQERLTQAVTKDGFDISWVGLCGPDNVEVNWLPPISAWGCKDIIVSDVGRPADFASHAVNRLTTLKGCEAWEEAALDLDALQRYAQQVTSWVYSGVFLIGPKNAQCMLNEDPRCIERMVDSVFKEAVEEGEAIRTCRRRDDPECTIRFVPMKLKMRDMSSTRVRQVIRSGLSQERLPEELQQLVLHPEILLELISRKR